MDILIEGIKPPDESYKYDKDEIERLKESIKANGLFHPIILQIKNGEDFYSIISGRARFIAVKSLGNASIFAKVIPPDCKNPHEIALHENLRRHNLPWYDQVELEKELHELRISQHGRKDPKGGRPTGEKQGWSQNDTARELGLALGTFCQDMTLANELRKNPNLRNVKDKTTALKLVKQIVKRHIAEVDQMISSNNEMDEVFLGDSAVILKSLQDNLFDCCITDPPWSEYRDESLTADQSSLLPVFFELFRVLRRDAFLFMITSTPDFAFYSRELPKIGYKIQVYPIIWHKLKTITHGKRPWEFERDYEPILVAIKGNPSLTSGAPLSSVLKFDNVHYSKMIHPNEKPIELINYLLKVSTNPGAKVIDVFAGSGVVLESCKREDRKFIGIEKEKKFYDGIMKRLESIK